MPKAKPFPDSEEEEKTTIESQWEDEASTTVEQGDVAEKIRELGVNPKGNRTGITQTGAVDEPTVDDQHAQMSAITPVRDIARLVITQGSDIGNEFEIRPGKPYTIGRAIDNDVVLTDIAVSRKHFDLRFEDGAWVIVDRGSGNGTVVNGNLEDNPFMLANGDVIEIGNTVFKFDQPNAAPRPQRTMELESDEEELSTVAGKPVRGDNIDELHQPLGKMPPRQPRPKTLPPPTPLRTASSTQPPPLGFPPPGPPLPASTLPLPQMANRPPIGTPHSPSMLGDPNMMAAASAGTGMPLGPNGLPTTIPGQGMPQRPPIYPYPQAQANEIPPHSVHAQMLLIQTQNRRGDGSTAHVPPTPYDGMPAAPQRYSQPQLTRRAKLTLAGIGLAVFAAVMTVAIVKSGSQAPKSAAATGDAKKTDAKSAAKTEVAKTTETPSTETAPSTEPKTTVTPIDTKSTTPQAAPPTPAAPTTTVASKDIKTPTPAATTPTVAPSVTTPAKTEPAKTEPAKTTPTVAKTETKAEKAAKFTPPKRPPVREKREARPPPQPKVEKVVEKTEAPPPPQKRVATADPDAAKTQADNLYRAKKFNEASSVLAKAASKMDDEDAKELRRTSDMYAKLGRALAQGTAPATRPTEAFEALRQAQNYDRNVGNAFDGEINQKLAQVAPKAAISYMANHSYPQARSAVLVAQQFGASDSVKLVLQKLESAAGELYNEAIKEQETNPIGAKDKLRQIKLFADPKSPWYAKASKALSGS